MGDGKEFLSSKYKYRSDHLVDRIDFLFDKNSGTETFSCLYIYDDKGKKTTRLIDRKSNRRPVIDIVRTYNSDNQLIQRITPFLSKIESNYSEFHLGFDDAEEIFVYSTNGILLEVQTRKNGHITQIEKHYYK